MRPRRGSVAHRPSRGIGLGAVLAIGFPALLLFAALTAPVSPVEASSAPISFGVPTVMDPIHTSGEPDIDIDGQGRVWASGPTGTGTQRSIWEVSHDGGQTFRLVQLGPPPSAFQGTTDSPGGGDTEIAHDRSGVEYFADLYALACLHVARSSDGGATTQDQAFPGGCSTTARGADRQWMAVYDPPPGTPNQSAYTGPKPLIYMEFATLSGVCQWTKSVDGLNYASANSANSGCDGYPAIDQVTGKVFEASGSGNDLQLTIGTPQPNGNLTFGTVNIASGLGGYDELFPVLSMDSARNLFVVWARDSFASQRQVFVSAAAPPWTSWTTPVQVSDGSKVTGDAVNVFPWIKAGGPGRADAVWYGSNKNADPSSTTAGHVWNVFMNQVVFPTNPATGFINGAVPAKNLVEVSPHPVHYGDICLSGSGCIGSQGNRNLLDFFQVNIDSSGAAMVIYTDTSNGLVQQGMTLNNNQTLDHAGAGIITIARQCSGPGLFGTEISTTCNAPVGGMNDAPGDGKFPLVSGSNHAGMDLVQSAMSLSGSVLTVTMQVVDLSNPAATALALQAPFLQYVTRWQMRDIVYFAAMQNTAAGVPVFYAGGAQSVDLCSISACDPHIITYPEPPQGALETGSVHCPAIPSATNPCAITIQVNTADIGSPSASPPSLLEEIGAYAFAASHPQGLTTNAQAEADNVPLEIDGVCCYNWSVGAPPI